MPDYGPHSASYIAQSANSCVACHTSGYASVPAMHAFLPTTTYHDSTTACAPCHVRSLTTEHYRYGGTCFTCHASANPLVASAIAAGRTDCEACHPGAATHTSVHEQPVPPECSGSGCHSGTALTNIHKGTCKSCHDSTDPRVVAAIDGGIKTCDACHSTEGHEAKHVTTVDASCAGSGCHSGTSLTSIHINADGKYSCATCHSSTDSEVTAAIAAHDKRCAACHTTAGVDYHAAASAKHVSVTNSGCFGAGCHPASKSLPDVHALYAGPGSQNPQFATSCALCHANPAINVKTSGSACTGACHISNHTGMNAGHTVTSASAACTECHGGDINSVHGSYSDMTRCDWCHSKPDNWSKTGDCANCHTGDGTAFHADKDASHALPATPSCVSAGCHDTGSTVVFEGKRVDQIHSAATTTTAGGVTRTSCQVCHYIGSTPTTNCGTAGCHPDRLLAHGYESAKHLATPASDIPILGSTYQLACVTCHTNLELGPLHMAPAGSATCASCHAVLVNQLSAAPETGWQKGCVQAGCHSSAGPNPMHPTIDADHTRATGGASDGCMAEGCHTGGTSLAAIHAPKQGCATCHAVGKTPTADCAASGCHNMATPHANLNGLHVSAASADTIGATHGDSVYMSCSDCHTTALMPLHANYCALCHGASASATVKAAVANHDTHCTTCHPSQHVYNDHSDLYDQGDWSCGPCHGSGCTQCHSAWTPVPTPVTTSDAKATYINDAVINLSATDNVSGSFGIKATYYALDGAAAVSGTQITIPAPAVGTQAHTLRFWSTDWSGQTETANTVLFTVSADIYPPVTTSNVVSGKTYAGDQTFTLAATDANSSVAGTWWQLDGTAPGGWTSGTSVPVAGPLTGTASHTLYFYSRDVKGNSETTKSVAFSSTAGQDFAYTGLDQTFVVPSGVTTIAVTMNGGSGGNSNYYGSTVYALGGLGGRVATVIPVTPGSTLTVKVGNAGADGNGLSGYMGGWPTGGNGRFNFGSGGGGSSSLWLATSVLAEAGGGGGAGNSTTFGVGGAGGALGTAGGGFKTGATATLGSAGGGGGGWNAGAAGSTTSRGGTGGTSYVVSGSGTVLTAGANTGAGSVAIRYSGARPGPFTLTYTAGANGTVSGTSPQTVAKGASGTAVTAVANTSYHFVNWSDGSTANPRTDTNVVDDKSVTANFAINTYTLTYTAGAGGTITGTSPQTVASGASGSAVTAVANTGYHFVSWSDGITTAARTDTNVLANKSVTATFAINTFTLTYTAGAGGTITGTSPQTVNYNASGTAVTAVANSGYHFVNWSDGITTAARTDANVTANKSVTANFAIDVYYTLTYTAGTGGTITGTSPQSVLSGGSGSAVTAVANSGYYFTGWSDGIATAARTDNNVLANKSVTANFAVDTGGSDAATSLEINGAAWMDASTNSSGPFGWFSIYADGVLIGMKSADDGTSTWNCPQTAVSSGARIDIVQNVDFSNIGEVYDANSTITYTTYLPAGSTRLNAATWTGFPSTSGGDGYDGDDWGYPQSDYVYVVLGTGTIGNIAFHTTGGSYTLTYSAGAGGTVTGTSPQTVVSGMSGTAVTAVANSGYHFVNWSDGITTPTRTDTNVTANKSVTANFAVDVTYTLTYSAGAGGTVTGTSPQTVVSGASGTAVTAVANTGYHFVNWSDGITTAARTDTNVTANKSVTANFAINTYTLTYSAGAGGTISGTSPQTVNYGASGTAVTAVANSGSTFVTWSDGVTTATRTDTNVTANKSVTANFTTTYTKGSVIPATGATQYFTVPVGVTSLTVDLYGGQGSPPGVGATGGKGGYLKATIAVTPGQVLSLKVGKAGNALVGGWGGGSGGNGTNVSAGGGSTSIGTSTTVLAEAGGGGGAGMGNGGDGGAWSASTTGGNAAGGTGNWCGGGGGWTGGASDKYGSYGGTSRTSSGSYITCTAGGNTTSGDGWMSMTWTDPVGTFTLAYTAGSGGTISGTTPQTVASGGSGTAVTAVANTGYHFVSWSDGISTATRTDTNVLANKSVSASFAINTYTLTYTAGTGGTITGTSPQTVNHGASGTAVTAVASSGYQFSSWSDGITTATRTDTNVVANKSVTASFTSTGATATVAFRWEPAYSGNWAYLRVLDESSNVIASTYLSGSGTDLNWYVTVPAGHSYHLDAYDWYDSDWDQEGSSDQWTDVLTPGQVWDFWY